MGKKFGTIFLDMDGVLCDFVGGVRDIARCEGLIGPEEGDVSNPDLAAAMGFESPTAMWRAIDARGWRWWADLQPYTWMKDVIQLAKDYANQVVVCTSPSQSSDCPKGKIEWLRRHMSGTRAFVLTPLKHLTAAPDRLLIDDSSRNCRDFRDAGGRALFWPMPWNGVEASVTPATKLGWLEDRLGFWANKL